MLCQDPKPLQESYFHLHTAKIIEQKARKVLGMLKRGVKFMPTQPDVLSILEQLKQKK